MTEAFILDGVRTPIGRYAGGWLTVAPDDLAALVVREAVAAPASTPSSIDEVVLGAANQAGEDNRNVARMAVLLAGLPQSVPGLHRQPALRLGPDRRRHRAADDRRRRRRRRRGRRGRVDDPRAVGHREAEQGVRQPGATFDTSIGWRFANPRFDADTTLTMPQTAERVAEQWSLTREELDAFALRSHERAVDAIEERPVRRRDRAGAGARRRVRRRRGTACRHQPRAAGRDCARSTTPTGWSRPATPVVAQRRRRRRGGRQRAVRGRARPDAAGPARRGRERRRGPEVMGIGPVPATRKALNRAGWTVDDLDAVELNEAFASQSLACIRDLGLDDDVVNADGGAIALGHPLGCSGARLVVTLLGRLERAGGHRGLATMCVGVGQGTALLVERA